MSYTPTVPQNDKRMINGWSMFDWANSAYALCIMTAIFPPYFEHTAPEVIPVLGREIPSSSFLAYAFSASYLIIALFSPALSGIADFGGMRKWFMKLFTWMGGLGCMGLLFFTSAQTVGIGTAALMLSTIGFAGGLVFYNSYIPIIATPDRYDYLSARGFAFGYVGSMIILIICLVIYMNPGWFFIDSAGQAARIGFVLVGVWWIGFAQIPFAILPPDRRGGPIKGLVRKGFQEIRSVWQEIRRQLYTKRFLIAFFCYSAASQTVFFMATIFASKELGIKESLLIVTILLLQVVGVAGAYFFAWLSDWKGNKLALMTTLMVWIAVCIIAYFTYEIWQFYVVASLVGLVMGGVQSLSRATYSKLLPNDLDDPTSYFSFYDVLEKGAIVFGTFSFGFIEQITGTMRNSLVFLILFFVLGILLLGMVRVLPAEQQPTG